MSEKTIIPNSRPPESKSTLAGPQRVHDGKIKEVHAALLLPLRMPMEMVFSMSHTSVRF
jgi:hypothetical protein